MNGGTDSSPVLEVGSIRFEQIIEKIFANYVPNKENIMGFYHLKANK